MPFLIAFIRKYFYTQENNLVERIPPPTITFSQTHKDFRSHRAIAFVLLNFVKLKFLKWIYHQQNPLMSNCFRNMQPMAGKLMGASKEIRKGSADAFLSCFIDLVYFLSHSVSVHDLVSMLYFQEF